MKVMGGKIVSWLVLMSLCFLKTVAYQLPLVQFDALTPRGLRVRMRDDGFSSFSFNGDMRRGETRKRWDTTVPRAKQGYWVFIDRNDFFVIGDTIIYTVSAVKNNRRYQTSGTWTVVGYVSEDDVPSCEKSETKTPCSNNIYKPICKDALIFSEEFTDADKFMWQKENFFPQEPDYPFNSYSKNKVRIRDGHLVIKPTLFNDNTYPIVDQWDFGSICTGEAGTRECKQTSSGAQILPPVMSGKVSTRKLFSFKYGRVEVRAKLPVGDWLIPEINLEPLHNEYGKQRYGSGLMRIACVKGNDAFSRELHGGPIVSETEPFRSMYLKRINNPSESWNDDFHVYTLIWKPNDIRLLVDGTPYGDLEDINGSEKDYTEDDIPHSEVWERGNVIAPLDQMFFLSLGVRVGGINDSESRHSIDKPWKNGSSKSMYNFWKNMSSWHETWTSPSMLVDYVRVYAL